MPQRFLRTGITNSERWNAVSWPAQSLFIRLITLVDDYGRCDGRTAVLLGSCFSIWNALNPKLACNLQDTEQYLQELAASLLIERYEVDGKVVIQIAQWQERIREGVKERFPKNPNETTLAASCSKLLPSSSPSPPRTPAQNPRPEPSPASPEPDRIARAVELPEGFPSTEAEALQFSSMVAGASKDLSLKVWNKAMSRNGLDSKGQPIRSFQHYLATEIQYERERKTNTQSSRNGNGRNSVEPDYSKGF